MRLDITWSAGAERVGERRPRFGCCNRRSRTTLKTVEIGRSQSGVATSFCRRSPYEVGHYMERGGRASRRAATPLWLLQLEVPDNTENGGDRKKPKRRRHFVLPPQSI